MGMKGYLISNSSIIRFNVIKCGPNQIDVSVPSVSSSSKVSFAQEGFFAAPYARRVSEDDKLEE